MNEQEITVTISFEHVVGLATFNKLAALAYTQGGTEALLDAARAIGPSTMKDTEFLTAIAAAIVWLEEASTAFREVNQPGAVEFNAGHDAASMKPWERN